MASAHSSGSSTSTNHIRSSSLGRSKSLRLPSNRLNDQSPSSPGTLTRHGSIRLPKSHSHSSDVSKPLVVVKKPPPPLKPKPTLIEKLGEKVNTLTRPSSSKSLAPPDEGKASGIYRTMSPKLDRSHHGKTSSDGDAVPLSAMNKDTMMSRSSASLSREMGFSLEVVHHWKRLTEEHDKLQMEYARLRLQHLDNTASKLLSVPFVRKEANLHAAYSDTHLDTIPEDAPSSLLQRTCFTDDKKHQHVEEYIQQLESLVQGYRSEVLRSQDEHRRMQRKYWEQVVSLDSCGAKEEASKQVFELLDKLDEKQKESVQSNSQVQEMKTQLVSVTEELQKCHNALQDYQYQIENGEHQRAQLERKLKDVATDLAETKDSVEFLQAERTTLAESLQETEHNLNSTKSLLERERVGMQDLSNRYRKLYAKVQDKNLQLQVLQSELESTQGRARDMLLSQGSELTLGAITLSQLSHRISSVLMSYIDYTTSTLGLEQEIINEALSKADEVVSEDNAKTTKSSDDNPKPVNGTISNDSSPSDADDGHKIKSTSIVQAIIQALEEQSASKSDKPRSNPHSPTKKNLSETSTTPPLCNGKETVDESEPANQLSAVKPVGMATAFRPAPKTPGEKHPLSYVNGDLSPTDCSKASIENQVKNANRMVNQLLTVITLMQKTFSSRITALQSDVCTLRSDTKLAKESEKRKDEELKLKDQEMEEHTNKLNELSISLMQERKKHKDEFEELQTEMAELKIRNRSLEVVNTEQSRQLKEEVARLARPSGSSGPMDDAISICDKLVLRQEVAKLKDLLKERDEVVKCLASKFTRNKKVWEENYQKAEAEVHKLDNIIEHILQTLQDVPEAVNSCGPLSRLLEQLTSGSIFQNVNNSVESSDGSSS